MVTGDGGSASHDGILAPEVVAQEVVTTMQNEQFLVLPHPEVATFVQRKAADPDRWLRGMRRLRAKVMSLRPH